MDEFALVRRALRGADGLVVIDDERCVAAAQAAGVDVLQVYEGLTTSERRALFPYTRAPEVFAIARLPRRPTNKSIAALPGHLLVLDGVRGPGNTGAIVRSAAAFDIAAVISLDGSRRDLFRRAAIRAGGSAMFSTPLQTMTRPEFIEFCRRNDIVIAVTAPNRGTTAIDANRRTAVVLGSETKGCSVEIEQAADVRLTIPINSAVDSLNVSAAAALFAYRFADAQRRTRAPSA